MPRIVSLIASATEIVSALGMERDLVGRSHECDFPESIRGLPVCTAPRFNVEGSSREIDERVKNALRDATSVYRVHEDVLRQLAPDVIITQTQCEVCAVSQKDVEEAICSWLGRRPRIVSLEPNCLADVWRDIERVAEALEIAERGRALVHRLQERIETIARVASPGASRVASPGASAPEVPASPGQGQTRRLTVACLEWLDPLMAAGNWTPELVELAGGDNRFGEAGKHSPWMTWEALWQEDPQVIIAMPCGYDLAKTAAEMAALTARDDWPKLRAVRDGRVYITDGNQFFNRPGPRLVESLEILVEILHPDRFHYGHEDAGWKHYGR